MFIDSAYNVPNHDSPARMVNPSTEVMIALTPERTYATSGIKSFTAEQRQCYYSDEVRFVFLSLMQTNYLYWSQIFNRLVMIVAGKFDDRFYTECLPSALAHVLS